MRVLLICTIATLAAASTAYGSAGLYEVDVLRWQKTGARELWMEIIEPRETIKKTVHVRFRPDRIARFIQQKELRERAAADYDAAFARLCQQLAASTKVPLWLYSERGFSPIRGRKGHFRTDHLHIPPWDRGAATVCLVPTDLDTDSPD